jgi:BED zinc finger
MSLEDNEEQSNSSNKKRGGSYKKSWVWDWFKTDENGIHICQVEVFDGQICNRQYKTGSSTSNLINHLTNKHQINDKMKKKDFVVRKKL